MTYFIALLDFLVTHPLATFCGISAFIVSCWTGYLEKNMPADILLSGIVSVFAALGLLDCIYKGSQYHIWLPLTGIIVGFIGPHRTRSLIFYFLNYYINKTKKIKLNTCIELKNRPSILSFSIPRKDTDKISPLKFLPLSVK